jgi:hypothetical protein
MKKLVETWLLKTVDGRDVHMDSSGTVRYKETGGNETLRQ